MSDALSFVQMDGEHVELLPARTVLSLFCGITGIARTDGPPGASEAGSNGGASSGGASNGGASNGGAPTHTSNMVPVDDDQWNTLTSAAGGFGGSGGTGDAGTGGAG